MSPLPAALLPMVPLSDEEVVARVLGGDSAVFELLMRRHNQRLFRIVRSVTTSDDEADDIVQEAYMRAYSGLSGFEGRSSVATWLSRIAFHEALRRRDRRRLATKAALGHHRDLREAREPAAVVGSEEWIETTARLTSALDALPPGLRSVAMLRLVQELSSQETAECLRMTESNVRVSLHRARRLLANSIGENELYGLSRQFAFDGERCDRIVADVYARLNLI
jgi:RNA polymerase sigma-70 factor (ECF subfamily)